jgi:predicted nucleic acid-binding protein
MYLVDTNIFLEILLGDHQSQVCQSFLQTNIGNLNISDFSLHSIGVVLYRERKYQLYPIFIRDTLPLVNVVSLPIQNYFCLEQGHIQYQFDFDDAYQYCTAKYFGLTLKTLDRHFLNRPVADLVIERP